MRLLNHVPVDPLGLLQFSHQALVLFFQVFDLITDGTSKGVDVRDPLSLLLAEQFLQVPKSQLALFVNLL